MTRYFHFCLTCPRCHGPFSRGVDSELNHLQIRDNGNIFCETCSTEFHPFIDFSKAYPVVNESITDKENQNKIFDPRHVPLCWEVIPNYFENEYLKWALKRPSGTFLITWPWRQVRFLPILITEYLRQNHDARVVIIGDFANHSDETFIVDHRMPDLFNKLILFEDLERCPEPLKKEVLDIKKERSLLFDRKNVVNERSRRWGTGQINERNWEDSLTKCINRLKSDASDYCPGELRTITRRRKDGTESPGYNQNDITTGRVDPENGKWDVVLTERVQWPEKPLYNIIWLCEVIANLRHAIRASDIVNSVIRVDADKPMQDLPAKLFLIDKHLEPQRLFSFVRDTAPTMVIAEDADFLIKDFRSPHSLNPALSEYLQGAVGTVLLFSTNYEWRQFYDLEGDGGIFSGIPITIHSLDSPHIINQFSAKRDQSRFPNPLSSMMDEVDDGQGVKIEYFECEALTALTDEIRSLTDALQGEFGKDFRFYLRRVLQSPLNIIGDYSDYRYLIYRKYPGNYTLTYDGIEGGLFDIADTGRISNDLAETFRTAFHTTYLPEGESRNPLRDLILRKVKEVLERDPASHVVVIVYYWDVKGMGRFIDDAEILSDPEKARVDVSSWRDLHDKILAIRQSAPGISKENSGNIYVISSQFPALYHNLSDKQVKEYIFIGDRDGISRVKEIIRFRLQERFAFPVVQPQPDWDLPDFLRAALDAAKAQIPPVTRIEELYQDIDDEVFQSSIFRTRGQEIVRDSGDISNQKGAIIEKGEEVFLCVDYSDRAVFIQKNKSVLLRKLDFFEDYTLDEKLTDSRIEKDLRDEQLILNKSGLYLSMKGIFFRFMMRNAKNKRFEKWPYKWESFEELYYDSIRWVRLIEKAIETYSRRNPDDARNAGERIATKIIDAGVTAREKTTVSAWYRNYDPVIIGPNSYKLYRTEHPFVCADVRILVETLSEFLNPEELSSIDSEKIFAASLCLQDFREKVLHKSNRENSSIVAIRAGLKKELVDILYDAEVFSPKAIRRVILAKPVESMRIIKYYRQFLPQP